MTREDEKLFQADEELVKRVDNFLDKYGVADFKGKIFLRQMIVYQTKKEIYQKEVNKELYPKIAELNKTTVYNVVRLVRYACYVKNEKKPIKPIELMYRAWYELKLELTERDYNYVIKKTSYCKV